MKRVILAAIAALAMLPASAADDSDRPVGVSSENWIRISDRFGFVVDQKPPQPDASSSPQILIAPPQAVSAVHMPPTKGYFVIKTSLGWRRVVIAE